MRLEPLYRLRFEYTDGWSVDLAADGAESAHLFMAEGTVDGAITGRFRGANSPHRRTDGTFLPDMRAVIETDDGATVLVRMTGYGRTYPENRRQVVGTAQHVSDHPRLCRLNDAVCPIVGEVRPLGEDGVEIVVDVAELIWEPLAGDQPPRS